MTNSTGTRKAVVAALTLAFAGALASSLPADAKPVEKKPTILRTEQQKELHNYNEQQARLARQMHQGAGANAQEKREVHNFNMEQLEIKHPREAAKIEAKERAAAVAKKEAAAAAKAATTTKKP